MNDLISRKALLAEYDRVHIGEPGKARKLIEDAPAVREWIPVSERLPEKLGQYICRYVFGENTEYPFTQILWYYANLENPHFQHEGSMGLTVTHWMPLPEPPKEE